MKVAIVCDWLVSIGGAEKVLSQILDCFPDADLFSLIDFLPPTRRDIIKNKSVKVSFIQKLPFAKRLYRTYLPLMLYAVEQFDFSEYNLIISSSHSIAKGIITGPDQLHICYCHSPMRYAWDLRHEYLEQSNMGSIKKFIITKMLHSIRIWDWRTSVDVDYFIANSHFIARRIYKTYKRDAVVIYPPVAVNHQTIDININGDFYITSSRFVPYKKVNLIIEAFIAMPERKLVVIGDGPLYKKLYARAAKYKNIIMLGYQEPDVLYSYLAAAKAFVFAAQEDFGIAVVEALMLGIPVIAYAKGGALETVNGIYIGTDNLSTKALNPNGVFYTQQTALDIQQAVKYFEMHPEYQFKENCSGYAQQFSNETFKAKFMQFVLDKYSLFHNSINSNVGINNCKQK